MRKRAALGFLAVLLVTGNAWAESVYLDYSATPGCPSRDEFERQVQERTALVQFVHEPHSGRFFKVYAGVESTLAVGRLTSGRGNEAGSAREVSSQSCEHVVAALALITALAIDPNASVAPLLPPTAAFPSENVTTQPVPDAPSPVPLEPSTNGSAAPPFNPIVKGGGTQRQTSLIALGVGARLGGSLWLTSPVTPLGTFGVSLFAENTQPTLYAAAVQLTFGYTRSTTVHTENSASARFEILSAELAYCPLRFELSPRATLRPCAALEGGQLTGTGSAGNVLDYAGSQHRRWWAISELARLQVRLRSGWQFFSEAGLSEPFWHYRFVFLRPEVPIANVPVLVPRLNVGLTWLFL